MPQSNKEDEIQTPNECGTQPSIQSNVVQSEARKRKQMESKSEVWDHFERFTADDGSKIVKCVHGGKVYALDPKKNGIRSLNNMNACKTIHANIDLRQKLLNVQSITNSTMDLSTWKIDQGAIRKVLTHIVIVDELFFKFVDNKGFNTHSKRLIFISCPRFQIPSRWTTSCDCYQIYID